MLAQQTLTALGENKPFGTIVVLLLLLQGDPGRSGFLWRKLLQQCFEYEKRIVF